MTIEFNRQAKDFKSEPAAPTRFKLRVEAGAARAQIRVGCQGGWAVSKAVGAVSAVLKRFAGFGAAHMDRLTRETHNVSETHPEPNAKVKLGVKRCEIVVWSPLWYRQRLKKGTNGCLARSGKKMSLPPRLSLKPVLRQEQDIFQGKDWPEDFPAENICLSQTSPWLPSRS